ncbi:toll-like receptor 4 [Physella acuta]|uniref:toll-like receptor 4 n=1 Tax=Physella acuta TaxID=109671 RepID=UPI0027DE5D26|nr:toll-like receptor 4 [Physella acuta]XP_059146540.1 toll-like receptor 4 [Physella acuta]
MDLGVNNQVTSDLNNSNKRESLLELSKTQSCNPRRNSTYCIYSGCRCYNETNCCDCSGLRLTSVPQNLPPNITKLDLYNNALTEIPPHSLKNYSRLRILHLNSNNISKLNESSFSGLENLTFLRLDDNSLAMTPDTFPVGVFKPLVSLTALRLNKNFNSAVGGNNFSYPDLALSDLKNLKALYIDGLTNASFGVGFSRMTSLVNFTVTGYLDGYCNIICLSNTTFQYLGHIKVLNLSNCHLRGGHIDKDAFTPLVSLEMLDIHYNEDIGIKHLQHIMHGLRNNTNLWWLDVSTIEWRYSTGTQVNASHVVNLPKSLTTLKVAGNSIEKIDNDTFDHLPPNLTLLDIGKNRIVFGVFLEFLPKLTNLQTLLINGEDYLYDIPTSYNKESIKHFHSLLKRRSVGDDNALVFHLPPQLSRIEMVNAELQYRLSRLTIVSNNSLTDLVLDRNFLPELQGPFIGFNHLTTLSIYSSYVSSLEWTFFSNFPRLENLNLGTNLLGDFLNTLDDPVFANLTNLKKLDLSINNIQNLSYGLFIGLNNLTILDLSNNRLSEFNVNISGMKNLRLLNLSHNSISSLPDDVMESIDWLIDHQIPVEVELNNCPILCTCQNLKFLTWMVKSPAFKSFKSYICAHDDVYVRLTNGYNKTVELLNKECASNEKLFLFVVAATLLVLFALVGLMIFRFRWSLRYLYHAAMLNFHRRHETKGNKFDYDVFISYANPDELFVLEVVEPELVKRGVKVHIHGRNFVAGNFIASNIVSAVSMCRRTLVILTGNFCKSHWCKYEVQMANMESVHDGRPVLIFLVKENMAAKNLGELMSFLRCNTYIPYPQGEQLSEREMKAMWDKLAQDLR